MRFLKCLGVGIVITAIALVAVALAGIGYEVSTQRVVTRGEIEGHPVGSRDIIYVPADKKVMLEGRTGDTYLIFKSATDEIEVYVNNTSVFSLGAAGVDIVSSNVPDMDYGFASVCSLGTTGTRSEGIAGYFEGHIPDGVAPDGPTYGAGAWLNIDPGATTTDVRGFDCGIYESGADCSGGNAYGWSIHLEFDDTNPPAAIYPLRINCNDTAGHATAAGLIFAPNRKAIGLVDAAPGSADAYLKIKLQDGSVYRMMLVKE